MPDQIHGLTHPKRWLREQHAGCALDRYREALRAEVERQADSAGWSVGDCPQSGAWEWNRTATPEDGLAYATPFWEGEDGITVQIMTEDGDGFEIARLPFPTTGDIAVDGAFLIAAVTALIAQLERAHAAGEAGAITELAGVSDQDLADRAALLEAEVTRPQHWRPAMQRELALIRAELRRRAEAASASGRA